MSSSRPSTVGAAAPDNTHRLIASTVHGLEGIAADELTQRGHRVVSIRKRQILLASASPFGDWPRTVDDLLVHVADTGDPGATKSDLARLRTWLRAIALPQRSGPVLSVSASMSGRRTYNRHDLEAVVGAVLADRLRARFASRDGGARPREGATEWRVILSADGLLLGLRGNRPPLHRRPWKVASIPGTLHPPVAAAMARLARIEQAEQAMTVLDPCCGAGTILREARELAPHATIVGSDLDRTALAAAARNAPGIALTRRDAARLRFPAASVDRIVTNPAWGRQVAARRPFPALLAEWRRVIADDGRLVCLVPPELLPHFGERWTVTATHTLSLSGRHPVLVEARPRA